MSCQAPRDAKEHDACLQEQWLIQFGQPVAARIAQTTPAEACQLIAQGDQIAATLLSTYKRSASAQNLLHTQVWPDIRKQLQAKCSQVSGPRGVVGAGAAGGVVGQTANPQPSALSADSIVKTLGDNGVLLAVAGIILLLVLRK